MIPNVTHESGQFFVNESLVKTSQVMILIEQLIEANAELTKDLARERHKFRLLIEELDSGIDSPE